MKAQTTLSIALAALLATACTTTSNESSLPVIDLNSMSDINKKVELDSDALDWKQTFLPLETTDSSLIASISQIEISSDAYWIVSKGTVYKFDKQGKFIGKLGSIGQGPEEFTSAEKIRIDEPNNEVFVMDYWDRKMVTYDMNGKFIRSFLLPPYQHIINFSLFNDKLYYYGFDNGVSPALIAVSTTDFKTDTISKPDREMNLAEAFMGTTFMSSVDNDIYLYHYFNDTIFHVQPDNKLTPAGLIQMQDLYFDYDEITINENSEPLKRATGQRAVTTNFVNTDRYYFVIYKLGTGQTKDKTSQLALYDKKANKSYANVVINDPKSKELIINGETPLFSPDGKTIISYIQAFKAVETDLFPNITEEDNPILVIYEPH
ncbi:MAG: 6-bladed beta-propeller [Tannerellaceae bacterium]